MAEKHASLVEVHKDGDSLLVHPDTVASHVAAGWQVAADQPKAAHVPEVDHADHAPSHRHTGFESKHVAKPKRS